MDKEDREGAPTDSLPPVYPRALRHGHLLLENRSETLCSPRCRHLQGQRLLAIDPGPRCKSGAEGRAGWRCSPRLSGRPAAGSAWRQRAIHRFLLASLPGGTHHGRGFPAASSCHHLEEPGAAPCPSRWGARGCFYPSPRSMPVGVPQPPAPPRPARHGAAAQNLPSSFYGNGGRKKKQKNSKHLILQPTWEPFKLPVRCLTCNNFSAFKIILKRSFSFSLKISAVEPPKEISIKNTDTCRKYQFVTVAGDRQPQAPGKWKGTELHGTGAARGRRWLRADPGHGMGTGWERQHRESWAGGRGQERRWAGC